MVVREVELVYRRFFCFYVIFLLVLGYLVFKGVVGFIAGAWDIRGVGIGDVGFVIGVGRGVGVGG